MNEIQTLPYTGDEIALAERIYVRLIVHASTSNTPHSWQAMAKGSAKLSLDAAQVFYDILLNRK